MPALIAPTDRLRLSWLAARDEWSPGAHRAGSGTGLMPGADLDDPAVFSVGVERLRQQSDRSVAPRDGRVHATHWWIVEGDSYMGAIDLRHRLTAFLLHSGGQIGYSVRPSARKRGLATWALGAVLPEARALGLGRVLITCDDDNAASARIIERNGGVLEDVRTTEEGVKRRYWITL
ncbi:GNAT family N-acetyltransferase [Streptomyces caniscabiei]|uniref:GNAT family N-acetyltransferase n=1 Tax=Streptomyces caniscabiei TaxID=2746961 RepID=UPI000A383B6A|nr:GNAT family N-acetyltransferase [Streptomyces caniscabiei]